MLLFQLMYKKSTLFTTSTKLSELCLAKFVFLAPIIDPHYSGTKIRNTFKIVYPFIRPLLDVYETFPGAAIQV